MNRIGYLLLFIGFLLSACGTGKEMKTISPVPGIEDRPSVKVETARLQQEGFHTVTGRLPLEEQLEEAWKYQREKDPEGNPVYYVASSKVMAVNYNVARIQAGNLAKVQLAGLMETRIGQLVTQKMEVNGTEGKEAVIQMVSSSKNLVTARLSHLLPVVEIYRDLPDGRVEVQITLACKRLWATEVSDKLFVKEGGDLK